MAKKVRYYRFRLYAEDENVTRIFAKFGKVPKLNVLYRVGVLPDDDGAYFLKPEQAVSASKH